MSAKFKGENFFVALFKGDVLLPGVLTYLLFLTRTIYRDHNLKKIIGACILAQTQTSSIEEAKQFCADKFK